MIAATISTGASARIGAQREQELVRLAGTKSSLKINFSASATKWRMPFSLIGPMLARFGPRRSCIIAHCRRSAQVSSDASGIRKPSTRNRILMSAVTASKPTLP